MMDASAPAEAVPATSMTALKTWAHRIELSVLLVALLYSLVFWFRLPTQLPTDADYLALQAALQTQVQPGDGAAVLPFWADRAKVYLHGLPILGLPALDSQLDAERYRRLWVVAQPALPRSDAAETLEKLGMRLDAQGAPRKFGPLELWLFVPKPGRAAIWDFVAHPGEAQVQSNGPVQLLWREFDFLPRHCFALGGSEAVLRFPAVDIAHGLRLGVGSAAGSPPQVSGNVDGRSLPPVTLASDGPAYQTRELPLAPIKSSWMFADAVFASTRWPTK